MKTRIARLALPLILVLALGGCSNLFDSSSPAGDDTYDDSFFADMNYDLDDPTGGYDAETESPGFGEQAFFSMFPEDEPANDPIGDDPGVRDMENEPASNVYYARLLWGQLQYDPDVTDPTDWTGRIQLDQGALVIERLIRFEHETDWIEPRDSILWVDLTSITYGHNDGLLLKIIDDEPGLGINHLHVDLGGLSYSIPVDSLDGFQEIVDVDELGNQFSITALPRFDCPNGFMRGIWVEGKPDGGIFRGAWASFEGELIGHYRGHWGISDEGNRIMRGKLIDLDGEFLAYLGGTWNNNDQHPRHGDFHGQWLVPIDEDSLEAVGNFWGVYRKSMRRGGFMAGRWLEFCE